MINGLGSQCIAYRTAWCERFVDAGFFVTRFDNRDTGLSDGHEDVKPDLRERAAPRCQRGRHRRSPTR